MGKTLLIYGIFGGYNYGDELFSKVVTDAISRMEDYGPPVVLTRDRDNTAENVGKEVISITGFPIPNEGIGRWRRALRTYREADGVLFGGGGLFNEVFMRAAIPVKGIILATARVFGLPYVIHGIEIGYVASPPNKWITGWCLRHARRVICRNQTSVARAAEYGVRAELGVDLNHGYLNRELSSPRPASPSAPRLIINLQHSLALRDPEVITWIEERRGRGYRAVFLVNSEREAARVRTVYADLCDEITVAPTVAETTAALRAGDTYLSERFHFTMAALHTNRPAAVIVSSTKVRELLAKLAEAGAEREQLREGTDTQRALIVLPPSAARQAVCAAWGRQADDQLQHVLDHDFPSRPRHRRPRYLLPLCAFAATFVVSYVLDRYRPLNRELDLSKT